MRNARLTPGGRHQRDARCESYPIERFRAERRTPGRDAAKHAEDALARAQRSLDELNALADELLAPIPFPVELTRDPEDDGPRAA